MLKIVITIIIACIIIYGLHRLCLWLEKHGCIYYINKKADVGFLSGSLEMINSVLNPAVKHTIEMKQNQTIIKKKQTEDGVNTKNEEKNNG